MVHRHVTRDDSELVVGICAGAFCTLKCINPDCRTLVGWAPTQCNELNACGSKSFNGSTVA
jgi:hypothetical protein